MRSVLLRRDSRRVLWISLLYVIGALAQPALAQRGGEIRITAVHGDVHVQMAGVTTPVSVNAMLQLPATIRTGADGAVELRQGPTTIAAAGDTELLIPESAAVDGLIERIVQLGGNAFYNVGKREANKLRVETPHLVAVIKGTQFNVAAHADSTTVALYEGRLEVRAPDDSDVVDLHAGEIAIRGRDEVSIRVLRMNVASVGAPRSAPIAGNSSDAPRTSSAADGNAPLSASAPQTIGRPASVELGDDANSIDRIAGVSAEPPIDGVADAIQAPDVAASVGGADVALAPDLGEAAPGVSARVAIDLAPEVQAGVDLGVGDVAAAADVGVSIGSDTIAADVGASVDAGSIAADVGVSTDLSGGGVDVGVDVGAGAGPITADVGASTGLNNGALDVGADISIGAGEAGADVSADVGIDADTGEATADVDLGGVASVGADVDLQDPAVAVDADVGGLVDADLDLGTDGVGVDVDTGVEPVDDVVDAVDDVLGGLLNRRPRK